MRSSLHVGGAELRLGDGEKEQLAEEFT